MATVPAWADVTLFVMETEMLFPLFPLPAPAPQPTRTTVMPGMESQQAIIRALDADPKRCLVAITLLQVRELKGLPEGGIAAARIFVNYLGY